MLCSTHPNEFDVVPCSICLKGICATCAKKLSPPICKKCTEEAILAQNKNTLDVTKPVFLNKPQFRKSTSLNKVNTDYSIMSSNNTSQKRVFLRVFLILFLFSSFLGFFWNSTPDSNEAVLQRVQRLELQDMRQFIVTNAENDNFSKLAVIEGKVLNHSEEARSYIKAQATLADDQGNILAKKTQLIGTKLNFFQLQIFDESEIEEAINNQMDVFENNTNVQPNTSVPFIFVFCNPPENATNYNVRIVDAQLP